MKTLTALEREAFTAGVMAVMHAWNLNTRDLADEWVSDEFISYLTRRRIYCRHCNDRPPEAHHCPRCGRVG